MKWCISFAPGELRWVSTFWEKMYGGSIDTTDTRNLPLAAWWDDNCAIMERAERLLLVATRDHVASYFGRAEIDYALDLNRPVLTVMLHDCELPERLLNQGIPPLRLEDPEDWDKVIAQVKAAVEAINADDFESREVPRPALPPLTSDQDIRDVFERAEDFAKAERMAFAESAFAWIADDDPPAAARRDEIRAARDAEYKRMSKLVTRNHPLTLGSTISAWGNFCERYGKHDDPNGLHAILSAQAEKHGLQMPQERRSNQDNFTETTIAVLHAAEKFVTDNHRAQIGTEHLLYGLLTNPDTIAYRVLRDAGLSADQVESQIHRLSKIESRGDALLGWTDNAQQLFGYAVGEARNIKQDRVAPAHLLLGLLATRNCTALRILKALKARPRALRRETLRLVREEAREAG